MAIGRLRSVPSGIVVVSMAMRMSSINSVSLLSRSL
jgi:hypothetical protein